MSWQLLVPFVIPLITAVVAYRKTGSQRVIAIVATVAATGHYAIAVLDTSLHADPSLSGAGLLARALVPSWASLDRPVLSVVSLALFGVGLIACMMLLAGTLHHPVQWVLVAAGTLIVVAVFASFWFAIASVQCYLDRAHQAFSHAPGAPSSVDDCASVALVIGGVCAALLPLAKILIMDAPGMVDDVLKARAEPAKPRAARRRWHPAEWIAVGAGALLFAGTLLLFCLNAIAKDPAVMLMSAGVVIGAAGSRLIAWIVQRRDQVSKPRDQVSLTP